MRMTTDLGTILGFSQPRSIGAAKPPSIDERGADRIETETRRSDVLPPAPSPDLSSPGTLSVLFGSLPHAIGIAGVASFAVLAGCSGPSTVAPPAEVSACPIGSGEAPAAVRRLGPVGVTLAPKNATTPEARFAHYRAIVEAAGGRLRSNESHVLVLRGLDFEARSIHETSAAPRMSDTVVVLSVGEDGRAQVCEQSGSTHPSQPNPADARGVAMIVEGRYRAEPDRFQFGGWSFELELPSTDNGSLPAVRDPNHDGVFDEGEWRASAAADTRAARILFHPGFGAFANSRGCFNVRHYEAFVEAVGGKDEHFDVTVVNALGREPRSTLR